MLHSSVPLSQIKWSTTVGILKWLKQENIQIGEKKYDDLAEASIGFLPNLNPEVVLRSEIRYELDYCLETVDLTETEITILDEFVPESEEKKTSTLSISLHITLLNR